MKQHRLLASCAIALALVIAVANIVLGNLNLDEGWYLQAAANKAVGKMPYRDFFFTQAPLLPDVYGLLLPLWAPAGVLGGRIVTAVIGLFAALFAALRRRALRLRGGAEARIPDRRRLQDRRLRHSCRRRRRHRRRQRRALAEYPLCARDKRRSGAAFRAAQRKRARRAAARGSARMRQDDAAARPRAADFRRRTQGMHH